VFDNLAFPLRAPGRRVPEADIRSKVGEVAELLRITHKLQNRSTQLSGGEMQRVAIGRALVRRPAIYLMDEPLSSLDAKLRQELRLELKRIQAELGATILYVTHDQVEALTMASRIGVLKAGRLVQIGSPRQIYEDPSDTYVATRLGQPGINLVPRRLWPDCAAPANATTIGVRAEHLKVARVARSDSRVVRIEHLGDQNHLHLEIAGEKLVTLADPESGLAVGDRIEAIPHNPLYFAADGSRVRA
jgi:multiple sugar transport system ATP-binding protein